MAGGTAGTEQVEDSATGAQGRGSLKPPGDKKHASSFTLQAVHLNLSFSLILSFSQMLGDVKEIGAFSNPVNLPVPFVLTCHDSFRTAGENQTRSTFSTKIK